MINKISQLTEKIKSLSTRKDKKKFREFKTSDTYWETRYAAGGDSGAGSYGRLALFKAEILNAFVQTNAIRSVIEFGCGDGNQLSLAKYPKFIGIDVSPTILKKCSTRFRKDASKTFYLYDPQTLSENAAALKSDLALSLDVVYHLVEDEVFERYMQDVFGAGMRFVIVYSSNVDKEPDSHVRHREFTKWVSENEPGWQLKEKIPNRYPFDPESPHETSHADFYVFEKLN